MSTVRDEDSHPVERLPNIGVPAISWGRSDADSVRFAVVAYDTGLLRERSADAPGFPVPERDVRTAAVGTRRRGQAKTQRFEPEVRKFYDKLT